MDKGQRLTLLVTGSIAAVKTIPMITALRGGGYDVSVFLTRAPLQWKWVSVEDAKTASGNDVLTDDSSRLDKKDVFFSSQVVLVAPASANFLSQLAHASSELARNVLDAQRNGSKLLLAPAMNYMMWHHPAVQRNCAALSSAGAVILGPAKGHMACGDDGFGRMIDVNDMIEGTRAAAEGRQHPVFSYYEKSCKKEKAPYHPPKGQTRVLVALGGGNISWTDVEKVVADIRKTGMLADYVIDQTWAGYRVALENLTQQPVVADYFQIPEFNGMEHIRLPERAACVFIPFLDDALATAMAEGKADTLFLGVYLASKAPVVTTKACLQTLSPSSAFVLQRDGFDVIEDVSGLANYGADDQSKTPASR
ncbi:MAG: flavoprotein [Bdellovibrionales bacterium]